MRTALTILAVIAVFVLMAIVVLPARGNTTSYDSGGAAPGSTAELRLPEACVLPAASAVNGRRLFLQQNCYGCHGGRGGGGMCPNLREIGNSGNDGELFETIRDGTPNGMPGFGARLSSAQIRDLVAYIRSLRTPAEPTFTIWWR